MIIYMTTYTIHSISPYIHTGTLTTTVQYSSNYYSVCLSVSYLLSYLSRIQACARPPSAQAVSRAKRWFSCWRRFAAVVTRRAPIVHNNMRQSITKTPNKRIFMHKSSRLTSSAEGMAQGQGATAGVDFVHVEATHRLAAGQSLRCELLRAHSHHVGEYLACGCASERQTSTHRCQ